jgi:HK97 family phage major capsid protein/HK97 family phage prohead protease
MMSKQRRDMNIELRAEKREDGGLVLRGYAVKFNSRSVNLGGFTETVAPGSFSDVLQRGNADVVALFNHDPSKLLGRTPGTLRLSEDEVGLFMEVDLPDSELARSVHDSIARGDIKGQSFSFNNFKSTWNADFTEREITHVGSLFDVGPVTFPAYPDTDIAARDRDAAIAEASGNKPSPMPQAPKPKQQESIMDPKKMRERAQELATHSDALHALAVKEARSLNDDEIVQINEDTVTATKLINDAKVLEDAAQLRASLSVTPAPTAAPDAPQQRMATPPNSTPRVYTPINTKLRNYTPQMYGSVQAANEVAHRSGMFLAATVWNSSEAREWCELNGVRIAKGSDNMRAMGGSVNTAGGYLVPNEMEMAVINVIDKFGIAREICRNHPMSSDTKTVPIRDAGLTAYAIGENTTITESEKTWQNAELVARKWATLTRYSSEVSEDAIISMADDLTEEIGSSFAGTEDDCLLNGDGTNTYHGIQGIWTLMEADTWTGSLLDAASGVDTLAEITADDLGLLYGKMSDKYRQGAKWLCNGFTKAVVFDSIMAAAGGNQNSQLAADQPSTYMSYPIITSEKMYAPALASTVANLKVPILFGRFDIGCSFGNRRGMTVAMSDQRYFEYDQIAIRATERFDIVCHNANCGTTVGPIVGLKLNT